MNTGSIGDLSQSFLLRSRNTAIKQDIARLTEELATGKTAQLRNLLIGNYAFLTDAERKTDVLSGFGVATAEATQFTSAMQLALGSFTDQAKDLSSTLITAGISPSGSTPEELASQSRDTFKAMIGTLNSSSAGRQLFSGNTTNQPPMADPDAILADLTAATSSATTPADMIAQARAWFDDPAGFLTSAYLGSADAIRPFAVSDNEQVTLDVRASDPDFFPALRGAAVAALAQDPGIALSRTQQTELFSLTAQELLQGQSSAINLQARVGFAEARLDVISTRNAAEVTSLNLARNALLDIDPYEAATRLEEAQFQLQSIYSVTVRMSQLSLVNYL